MADQEHGEPNGGESDELWLLIDENQQWVASHEPDADLAGQESPRLVATSVLLPCLDDGRCGSPVHEASSDEDESCRQNALSHILGTAYLGRLYDANTGPSQATVPRYPKEYSSRGNALEGIRALRGFRPSGDEIECALIILRELSRDPQIFRASVGRFWIRLHALGLRSSKTVPTPLGTLFTNDAWNVKAAQQRPCDVGGTPQEQADNLSEFLGEDFSPGPGVGLEKVTLVLEHVVPNVVQWSFAQGLHPESPHRFEEKFLRDLCANAGLNARELDAPDQHMRTRATLLAKFLKYCPMAVVTREQDSLLARECMPLDCEGNAWQYGDDPWARYEAASITLSEGNFLEFDRYFNQVVPIPLRRTGYRQTRPTSQGVVGSPE